MTADYVRNRGIGLPILGVDFERRYDAAYLDAGAARAQINRVLGGRTVDQWISANPQGSIASFGLFNDAIWPGVSPDFLEAKFETRGFTLYRALEFSLRGSGGNRWFRDLNYYLTYSLARTEASSGIVNPELGASTANSRNWNSREWFGPAAGYDATHNVRALVRTRAPSGIELTAQGLFRTPFADNLFMPTIGTAGSAQGYAFSADRNGDGRNTDLLPGVSAGQFGRRVKSIEEVNQAQHFQRELASAAADCLGARRNGLEIRANARRDQPLQPCAERPLFGTGSLVRTTEFRLQERAARKTGVRFIRSHRAFELHATAPDRAPLAILRQPWIRPRNRLTRGLHRHWRRPHPATPAPPSYTRGTASLLPAKSEGPYIRTPQTPGWGTSFP